MRRQCRCPNNPKGGRTLQNTSLLLYPIATRNAPVANPLDVVIFYTRIKSLTPLSPLQPT